MGSRQLWEINFHFAVHAIHLLVNVDFALGDAFIVNALRVGE